MIGIRFCPVSAARARGIVAGRAKLPSPRWEGRFKRVLLEGMGRTLSTMAASIGLNPVRAGIGKDPGDYRRRGYAEAVAGWKLAGPGLSRVVMGVLPSERSGETAREQMRQSDH